MADILLVDSPCRPDGMSKHEFIWNSRWFGEHMLHDMLMALPDISTMDDDILHKQLLIVDILIGAAPLGDEGQGLVIVVVHADKQGDVIVYKQGCALGVEPVTFLNATILISKGVSCYILHGSTVPLLKGPLIGVDLTTAIPMRS